MNVSIFHCYSGSQGHAQDIFHLKEPVQLVLANIKMDTTHHKDILQKKHVILVDELNPDLFLHLLEPCFGKTCVDSIREQSTQKDKTRKLLWLLGTVPKEKYDYFCKVIAGLYPSVFKVLMGREAKKGELDFGLQKYTRELRKSVLASGNVPDNEIDQPIDLDTQYVRLALRDMSDDHSAFGNDVPPADYRSIKEQKGNKKLDIHSILPEKSCGTSTLIKGRAGVGKSTLTQYLIRQWAKGQWESSKTCVFLLNLRKLVHVQRDVTFTELLGMYAEYTTDTPDLYRPSLQWLKNNAHNVMILTDGIDELPDVGPLRKRTPKLNLTEGTKATPLDWCVNLMQKNILQNCTKVFISRPFEDLKKLACDRVIDVLGLTNQKIMEFIEKNVKSYRRDIVRDTLVGNAILLSVCSITFYCAALCRVLEVNSDIEGISFNTYTRITAYLIIGLAARKAPEEATCFFMSDLLKQCLPHLAALAHRGLMQSKNGLTQLVFSEEDLSATGISQEGMRAAKQSGLLTYSKYKDPENPHRQKLQAQFIHLSIQEFLAAARMTNPSCNASEQKLNLFRSGQFNMTDVFAFGLAFNETDMNAKHIQHVISQEKSCLPIKDETASQMIKVLQELFEKAKKDDNAFLQALLITHETQRTDVARYLAAHKIVNDTFFVQTSIMTAVDMMALFFMLKNSSVKTLELAGTSIDVASATAMQEFLKSSTDLETLVLHGYYIGGVAQQLLCDGLISSNTLKHLFLGMLRLSEGVSLLAHSIALNRSLQRLSLSLCITATEEENVGGTEEDIKSLCHTIKCSQTITCLSLHCQIGFSKGILYLSDAIKHSKVLTHLQLSDLFFKESDMVHLSEAVISSASLKRLGLDVMSMFHAEEARHLATALKLASNLKHFELSAIVLQPGAIRYLADGIRFSTSINSFELRCGVPDCGALVQFNEAIKSTRNLFPLKLDLQGLPNSAVKHQHIIDVHIVSLASLLEGRQCMVSKYANEPWKGYRFIDKFYGEE